MTTGADLDRFVAQRTTLIALAYRMLGDVGRAEDIVQDAWLRWERRGVQVDAPKAYLVKMVTRLCLNELDSARARREQSRGDRLPEPVDLADAGIGRIEALDRISMAFVVLLQRLTPAERAVLLLHEIFDFSHGELAVMIGKSEPACRQLLKRARAHIGTERRSLCVSEAVHRRLLHAFMQAASSGDVDAVAQLLTEDATLVVDAGPEGGTYGRVRNFPRPLHGRTKVAAFAAAVTAQGAEGLAVREHELNGQPAILVTRAGEPYTVIQLAVVEDQIRAIFMQADPARLARLA